MSPAPRALPRRTVLVASGTAVLAAAAACSSSPTPAPASSSTSASSSKASTSAAARSSASSVADQLGTSDLRCRTQCCPGRPNERQPNRHRPAPSLAATSDVESAGSIVVGPADAPILLAASNGTVVAHTAICTHQGCTVAASGSCPCHGSRFNVATGAVENGPATRPLAEIGVTVTGGQVYQADSEVALHSKRTAST